MNKITAFLKNEQGQDVAEYSLLLVLIAIAVVLVLTGLGTNVVGIYQRVINSLNSVAANTPAQ